MRGFARIYDVRMAQFVPKIEKLSHIIGARGSQDLRSPSPIMAPDGMLIWIKYVKRVCGKQTFFRLINMYKTIVSLRKQYPTFH